VVEKSPKRDLVGKKLNLMALFTNRTPLNFLTTKCPVFPHQNTIPGAFHKGQPFEFLQFLSLWN